MNKNDVALFKIKYIEDSYGNIDEKLKKLHIRVKYETEPPRGDGIYSIWIKDKKPPFWIYGRNIVLVGEDLIFAECVAPNTFSPIFSVCIDCWNEKYANLKEWYTDISLAKNGIELGNYYAKGKKRILTDWKEVEWLDLSRRPL